MLEYRLPYNIAFVTMRKVLKRIARRSAIHSQLSSSESSHQRPTGESNSTNGPGRDTAPSVIVSPPHDPHQHPPPLTASTQTLGLKILHEPTQAVVAIVDIVFIHGLTGNSYRTWSHEGSGVHWPMQLLPQDFPDARIMTFGYDADVLKFWDPVSSNRISNHAENLVGALARLRERTDTVCL